MISSFDYIIFSVANLHLGMPLQNIRRVIHSVEITPIPDSPYMLSGIINMEGLIMSVFSLRRFTGIPENNASIDEKFIVVTFNNREFVLVVDSVSDIITVTPEDIIESADIFEDLESCDGAIRTATGAIPVLSGTRFYDICVEMSNRQQGERIASEESHA